MRQVPWTTGKGLGGSSIISASFYARGNRKDFDAWAEHGATGWSYEEVLPYFLKYEDNRDLEYLANGFHSVGGPVTIEKPRYCSEIKDPIFEAAERFGYKAVDSNGPTQTGFYDIQGPLRNGQRCSTAKAYLVPAENRTNFNIVINAHVNKIIMDGCNAKGVEFDFKGAKCTVRAKREVIMAAGAVNTAKILMLSGIGPKEHLQKHKIRVIADLPVGNNFQDHGAVLLHYQLDPKILPYYQKLKDIRSIEQYIRNRTGPLSSSLSISVAAFLGTDSLLPEVDLPNHLIFFWEIFKPLNMKPEIEKKFYGPFRNKPVLTCAVAPLLVKSCGTIRLKSRNPKDAPLIDPNYFEDPREVEDVIEGMKTCQKIITSKPMRKVCPKPFPPLPGCEHCYKDEDRYFECVLRSGVVSLSSSVGTTKMGDPNDPTTVVDPLLRVKGVKGLRVVDASVMPILPAALTFASTLMVAEKASDIIRETIRCPALVIEY
ncbi:glucose dehydrogenase [Nephila pilipes]|uniref:Glucose dehydrogenase n=1 Tax=Nephila pilipes TaxID=299642 RepID=A0A8X6TMB0_NEPPI|nr:glucose dehydrogenase [Nephila pilipes]